MAALVLTVIVRILSVFLRGMVPTAISVDRNYLVVIELDPLHRGKVYLLQIHHVGVHVEDFTEQDFDSQLPVELILASFVPAKDLLVAPVDLVVRVAEYTLVVRVFGVAALARMMKLFGVLFKTLEFLGRLDFLNLGKVIIMFFLFRI